MSAVAKDKVYGIKALPITFFLFFPLFNIFSKRLSIRAGAKGGQGASPYFEGFSLLLTIHITNITTFLTNSLCFPLKSTLEVL